MTVQERESTWGQEWRQQRIARPRYGVLDFDAWRPYFVTPRMIAYMNRPRARRTWVVFGGFWFMLLAFFAWAIGFWMVLTMAATWDFLLLSVFAMVWTVGTVVQRLRARRRARH
jgi:hypothetical protein